MFDLDPQHEFLVGIDSDGCAFDTMEVKHKECFIPNIINSYELQGISKYAREAAEFVDLYSKSRHHGRSSSSSQRRRTRRSPANGRSTICGATCGRSAAKRPAAK